MTGPARPDEARSLSLSLVSHTNVGKTTLARTLLGRDIGEVRDQAHVTEAAEPHSLIETPGGERLLLWDTPGFGDSQRLLGRLQAAGSPWGWLLSQVWDRWRDRAFWASQQAIRHVMAQTDVALYLVNAAEAPEDAGYLAPELQLLAWLGKPVLVLLNQLGSPGAPADEALQVQRWRQHLTTWPVVQAVLPLDAFTRCWLQEAVLLRAVAQALPAADQPLLARLQARWALRQQATWQAATGLLAQRLLRAALDREGLPDAGWQAPLRGWAQALAQALGQRLGWASDAGNSPQDQALAALASRLDQDLRASTDALIRLHGLQGRAGTELLARMAGYFARREPVSEGRAAIWGGLVTGALAGLKADLVSGGLTMGGGLLAGGVLGALGAAGAARGVNKIRGLGPPQLAWQDSVLQALLRSALLGYLAVAHHGRGRGAWQQDDPPPAWIDAVDKVLASQRTEWQALWAQRAAWLAAPPQASLSAPPGFNTALQHLLGQASTAVLALLYPDAAALLGLAGWPAAAALDDAGAAGAGPSPPAA